MLDVYYGVKIIIVLLTLCYDHCTMANALLTANLWIGRLVYLLTAAIERLKTSDFKNNNTRQYT